MIYEGLGTTKEAEDDSTRQEGHAIHWKEDGTQHLCH
jgi:hypothetical protein